MIKHITHLFCAIFEYIRTFECQSVSRELQLPHPAQFHSRNVVFSAFYNFQLPLSLLGVEQDSAKTTIALQKVKCVCESNANLQKLTDYIEFPMAQLYCKATRIISRQRLSN